MPPLECMFFLLKCIMQRQYLGKESQWKRVIYNSKRDFLPTLVLVYSIELQYTFTWLFIQKLNSFLWVNILAPPMWNVIKENYEKLLIIATLQEAIACLFEQMLRNSFTICHFNSGIEIIQSERDSIPLIWLVCVM